MVQGRGDLHIGILLEKMRREGYEMQVKINKYPTNIHPLALLGDPTSSDFQIRR